MSHLPLRRRFGLRSGLAASCLFAIAFSLVLFSMGCGEPNAGVVLTIDSSLRVPDEVDRLIIRVAAQDHEDKTESRALDRAFPHSLAIDLDTDASPIWISVYGMKGTVEVSSATVEVRPVPTEVVAATMVLY